MGLDWFGVRYPTLEDLEGAAHHLGAEVVWTRASRAAFLPGEPGLIFVPASAGPLEQSWLLAHELGHLALHLGHTPLRHGKQERQADTWAACALLPEARVRAHCNASVDAFVGALSAHYEDLPPSRTPARLLAGRIARVRLDALTTGALWTG